MKFSQTTVNAALAVLKAKLFHRPTPLAVSWLITTRCNASCPYCGIPTREVPELPQKDLLRLMRGVKAAGGERLLFTGGEPLLRSDLPDLIEAANDFGMFPCIITNGLLLERRINALKGIRQITISFDGNAKLMDTIRGKGAHAAAVAGAEAVKALGIPLKMSVVLSKRNLGQVDYLLELAELFSAVVYFQPTEPHPLYSREQNPLAPPVTEYRSVINRLLELRKTNPHIGNSAAGLRYLKRWPGPAAITCLGGLLFARIEPDGRLTICGRNNDFGIMPSSPEGFEQAFKRLNPPPCTGCWGASRIELYLAYCGNLNAISNLNRLR